MGIHTSLRKRKSMNAYQRQACHILAATPAKYMKLDNPKRANIMALMKDKLNQLESLNRELMYKLDIKSRYHQIKELMGDRKYFETEKDIFCVGDECVVYQMRITDSKEAHQLLEKYMRCVWKDPQLIARLMEKQEKIQNKLLQMLSKEIVKESLDQSLFLV
jgi:hypothetical protein